MPLPRLPKLSRILAPKPTRKRRNVTVGRSAVVTVWTDDPVRAAAAEAAGVDRIGVEMGTACLPAVRSVVRRADLAVRLTAEQADDAEALERLLAEEFRVLYLPADATADVVRSVAAVTRGRAVLVATVASIRSALKVDEVLAVTGVSEVHINLEGIAGSLGLADRFETLAEPIVDAIAARVRRAGKRLGLGGIGRAFDRSLPLSSDLLYAEHARLRATSVTLAASFFPPSAFGFNFKAEVDALHERLAHWRGCSRREVEIAHTFLTGRAVPVKRAAPSR